MPEVDQEKVKSLLGGEGLTWLVERLRKKMLRGESLTGKTQLTDADTAQRVAVAKLMGRTPGQGRSLTVDLDKLASLLAHAQASSRLEDAVEALVGPVRNERAESKSLEEQWELVWERAGTKAGDNFSINNWLEDLRSSGLLKRFAAGDPVRAETLITQALSIVLQVPLSTVRLAELAASETGNSHALDRGQPVGSIVVRFATQLDESASWKTTEQRRDSWETLGVLCDELSAPVLVLNLRGDDQSLTGQAMNFHASAGEPYRISVRQLRRHTPTFSKINTGVNIFVCENPTVVDVAANRLGKNCKPLVCIDGQPKTASRLLLNLLAEANCKIHYHGDFDWDGIRIGNKIMQRHSAVSWRFNASDYAQATHSEHKLQGQPATADWDAALAQLMEKTGICIHEEQVLNELVSDLDVRNDV